MKEVLLLTGACAVGKTTIAVAWAKMKNGAAIECDYLTEWIYQKEFPHWTAEEEKFTAVLAAKIAQEYLNLNMSVAIENVWSPLGIELIKKEMANRNDISIKAVWLFCDLSENHRRDKLRVDENQMKERVKIVNDELAQCNWPLSVSKINSTNLTVDQTLEHINLL